MDGGSSITVISKCHLVTREKTGLLLGFLRKHERLRCYAETTMRIRVEVSSFGPRYPVDALKVDFDELALFCPNIVEIRCSHLPGIGFYMFSM